MKTWQTNLYTFITSSDLCSTSSKYSLFIRRYSCSATDIILSKNNWSLPPYLWNQLSPSTSFWYQFVYFRLPYSFRTFTHHFFLFWFPTLLIHNSLSHSRLKPNCFTYPTPVVSLLPPGLPSRTIAWTVFTELLGFSLFFFRFCAVS